MIQKFFSYFGLIFLSLTYFFAGYILGFYKGSISAYNDSVYQLNSVFEEQSTAK